MNEVEVRFLEVDVISLQQKLDTLGAKKIYDTILEEWIFKKKEWEPRLGRLRIRKNNTIVQIAYKETTQDTSKGNKEIEFHIDTLENALEFVEKMGLTNPRRQQKRRIAYMLGDVNIDIDFWPQIPPLVEIEAENIGKITATAKKLGFDMKDACNLDAFQVITQIYKVDLPNIQNYIFSS